MANLFLQDWLHKTFAADVAAAAAEVLGRPLPVRFIIDPALFQAAREREAEPAPARPQAAPAKPPALKRARPRRWRKLEEFVVGACNRVAHAARVPKVW